MSVITIQEAAKRLGVSKSKVLFWIRKGILPALISSKQGVTSIAPDQEELLAFTVCDEYLLDEADVEELAEELAWLRVSESAWHDVEE